MNRHHHLLLLLAFFSMTSSLSFTQQTNIALDARYLKKKGNDTEYRFKKIQWKASETAIIVCDMWDNHWCASAVQRVNAMVPRMNMTLEHARSLGITIVHAPSNTMEFYKDAPQRKKMEEIPEVNNAQKMENWYSLDKSRESDLPIVDSDGGCDDPLSTCIHCIVWKRQHKDLEIHEQDYISDSGTEINNLFVFKGIKNVIILGVHANMCVLGRPFSIRNQTYLGRNVVLVRDLTDSMYNPASPPYVTHDEGTELVIRHIEKYWCPTIDSGAILKNTK